MAPGHSATPAVYITPSWRGSGNSKLGQYGQGKLMRQVEQSPKFCVYPSRKIAMAGVHYISQSQRMGFHANAGHANNPPQDAPFPPASAATSLAAQLAMGP